MFQSGHLSLGPPAAWNSTEDTHQRNYASYTSRVFHKKLTDYSPKTDTKNLQKSFFFFLNSVLNVKDENAGRKKGLVVFSNVRGSRVSNPEVSLNKTLL